jgi:hypothetical protein
MLAVTGTLGELLCGSLFSLHLLFPHGYALDKIISNVFRGVTQLNFVTFANFCSNSFVSFNCFPLRPSVSLFMPIGKCSPAPTRPARLVVAASPRCFLLFKFSFRFLGALIQILLVALLFDEFS